MSAFISSEFGLEGLGVPFTCKTCILPHLHLAEFIVPPSPGDQGVGEGKWQWGRDSGCAVSAGLSNLFLSGWGAELLSLQKLLGRKESLFGPCSQSCVLTSCVSFCSLEKGFEQRHMKSLVWWWYSLFSENVGLAEYCPHCRNASAKCTCTLWALMCFCILQ